ncbi:MAG: lytic transglycosylase domain-containing protein [Candidatus Acidiferrales bacterium]
MIRHALLTIGMTLSLVAPVARADYAVLRSGVRLHITGHEATGEHVRLTVPGGVIEVRAEEIVSIEPEEMFPANPPATPLAVPFGELIRAASKKHGVDENLITHVIESESNFNPKAISPRRAYGLMQLLPQTAVRFGVEDVFNPAQNIDAGTRYLKELLEKYNGDTGLALAAYNAGPEKVEHYGGVPPYRETQDYVRRIKSKLAAPTPTTPAKQQIN